VAVRPVIVPVMVMRMSAMRMTMVVLPEAEPIPQGVRHVRSLSYFR
jgi:hypothetical protein